MPAGRSLTEKVTGPSAFALSTRAMYSAFVLPVGRDCVRKRKTPFKLGSPAWAVLGIQSPRMSAAVSAQADPKRGRFRTLLLTSLQNYLRERHRYVTRKKRSHQGMQPMSLSETETNLIHLAKDVSPEAAFNSAWSVTLVREVLEQARRACIADGFEAHWVVFEQRVVRPMLFGEKPASYKSLVERLDLDDRSQAANMMITVKRRFARMMLTETGRTMSRPEKALSEIKDILKDLEKTT